MKWFDGGERWNEKIQSGEEDNTVKQNNVSKETVEVSDMTQIGKVLHTYSTREGNYFYKSNMILPN